MNLYSSVYNEVERYDKLLRKIDNIEDDVIECKGVIINIKYDETPTLQIYIEKLDIRYNFKPIQRKILHLVDIEQNADTYIKLTSKQHADRTVTFELFQKINLIISIARKNMDKLVVAINEQDMLNLLE